MSLKDSALTQIRLLARHSGGELTPDVIEEYREDFGSLSEKEVREAFDEGLSARASGTRCLCMRCELDFQRIQGNEQLRSDYYFRRRDELRAMGIVEGEISSRIESEIRSGAALRGSTHDEAGE